MVRLYLATGFPEVAKCEEKRPKLWIVDSEVHPTYIFSLSLRLLGGIGIHGSLLNEIRGALFTDLCS